MPIEITNSQFIFIKPQHPYLAVAKDNQHFISLTETEMQKYTVLSNGLSYFLENVSVMFFVFLKITVINRPINVAVTPEYL
jgi:hypothetical protein